MYTPGHTKEAEHFDKLLRDRINVRKHACIKLVTPTTMGGKQQPQQHVHFQVSGKRYPGVTKLIDAYWGKPYVPLELKEQTSKYVKQPKSGLRCRHSDALKHGKLVDEELEIVAQHGLSALLKKRKGNIENIDRCTYNVLLLLRKKKWKPAFAQFAIYSTEYRGATAIDLLCRDSKNRLILVELKATLNQDDTVYRHGDRYMAPPLDHIRNSYSNHHQLQLALMHRMLEQDYGVTPHKSVVLRACATGITKYPLADWGRDEATMQRVVDFLASKKPIDNGKRRKKSET